MKAKLSGRAIAAQRLRDTTECRCGSYKPAIVTKTVTNPRTGKYKVRGYCENCIEALNQGSALRGT